MTLTRVRRGSKRALPYALLVTAGLVALTRAGTHASAANGPAEPTTVTPAAAKQTYLRDCATCHGSDARGTSVAPSLQGVGRAAVNFWVSTGRMPLVRNGRPPRSPQGQAPPGQYVADPTAQVRRNPPSYPPAMIAALVDYVASIAPGGPDIPSVDINNADLAAGGEIYRLQCAACHAWSGVGGALYQRAAPSLGPATPTQIAEAVRIGPGQMPKFGSSAVPPTQLDDLVGYVRYLDRPQNRGGAPLWYVGPVAEGAVAIVFGLGLLLLLIRWIGTRG